MPQTTLPHRGRRLFLLAATAAALVLGGGAGTASAQSGVGGQLFATGGTVELDVRPATAGFTSELFLQNEDGSRGPTLALNTDVGRHVEIGPFPAGRELVFGIFVRNTGQTFLMGPGTRNADGIPHAAVTAVGERVFDVGFEDVQGGGDRDYDDNVFRFTGNLAPNRPPVADDQSLTTPEDTPRSIALTGSDPEGKTLAFAIADEPAQGTLSGTAPALTYTPDADFHGSDSFTFTVDDGEGGTDTGTVTIDVTPVNDPPVAVDDARTTDENEPVTVSVLANDTDADGDALTADLVDGASHGTATCAGTQCTYRPLSNFVGTDSFTYRACDSSRACDDALVTIEVRGIGQPGRLTGGAWLHTDDGKIHHQVQLGCTAAEGGRLTVNATAATFELTQVDFALCLDDPALNSGAPNAGWNTHRGSGIGTYNGAPGYTIEWTLTDAGEPGVADAADIVIRDPHGAVVLTEHGTLGGGNHQAHAA
jgi:hypothetical protein